jgi:hypothetical protein
MNDFSSRIMKEWNIIDLDVFVNCFTHIRYSLIKIRKSFMAIISLQVPAEDRMVLKIFLFCLTANVQ